MEEQRAAGSRSKTGDQRVKQPRKRLEVNRRINSGQKHECATAC